MGIFNFFKRKPKEIAKVSIVTQPVVINPNFETERKFGAYRANAIARELEQRREEKRPPHPDNDRMMSEARMYAHMLIGEKLWTQAHLDNLEKRMKGI